MDNLNCSTRRITVVTAQGRFSAEITQITSKCIVVKSGCETRQYRSMAGALGFLDILAARLIFAPRFPLLTAGVKPALAEAKRCEGWLNSSASTLHSETATVSAGSRHFCPYCATRYYKAMSAYRAIHEQAKAA